MTVVVDVAARQDAARAVRFYRRKSVRQATAFAAAVDAAVRRIAPSPRRFAPVEEAPAGEEVREVYIARFRQRVLFRIVGNEVRVFAMVHASASSDHWLPRITDDASE